MIPMKFVEPIAKLDSKTVKMSLHFNEITLPKED
jgi:hypothetical protein